MASLIEFKGMDCSIHLANFVYFVMNLVNSSSNSTAIIISINLDEEEE